jgi:transposase-like protein
MLCTHCNSDKTYKNGKKHDKQRYFCRGCKRMFSETDSRVKHSSKEREIALILYLQNNSLNSIKKTINLSFDKNISINLVAHWIKSIAKKLKKDLAQENLRIQDEEPAKIIEMLELDEMYSYYYDLKKNAEKKLKFGLQLTEIEVQLLRIQ